MSGDRRDLERELTQHLADTAQAPRPDAAARVRARVADTPQRGAWLVRSGSALRSPGWGRAGALVAVASAALLVGIYIGQVGLPVERGPSASPSAVDGASAAPGEPWVEPAAYSFVLDSSCGERSLIGRFRVTVVGGTTRTFDDLTDPPRDQFKVEEIPTLGDLVEEVEAAERDGADVARLESDPGDGHPVEIEIDWSIAAIDDEACYAISEYVVRGQPSETPVPSGPTAVSYAVWERVDMPDPAPGVFGGGTPSSVVAFNGRYVAVGTIRTECCAEADPAANVGVVWSSTDGRDWQLVDVGDTFEHASLGQVVTDGERLIVAGSYAEPVDGAPSIPVGATWTSSDGVTWQRSPGVAPSQVAVTPSGLVGVHADSDGVASYSSLDGVTWTRHGTVPDVEEVSTLVAMAAGAMVIEIQPGAPLADGSPTQDSVVWVTTDGESWTAGATVENARLTSVAPFAGGFVAVGSRTEVLAEGGEVAAISSVWTSPDGLTWQERETDIGHPSENALGVFAVGEALVTTVECCGGDLPLVPLARVSEDGASWTPVPPQPAFEGVDVRVVSVVETPDGLLAVGSRWDPDTNHPVPQAWLASSKPMVWRLPATEQGAEVGEELRFEMGHCGLRSPIDFDGSLWAPVDQSPSSLEFDMIAGTIGQGSSATVAPRWYWRGWRVPPPTRSATEADARRGLTRPANMGRWELPTAR